MNQKKSPYISGLKWLSQSYDWKETLVGFLHDNKLVDAVLLYVFKIAIPASLFLWLVTMSKTKLVFTLPNTS